MRTRPTSGGGGTEEEQSQETETESSEATDGSSTSQQPTQKPGLDQSIEKPIDNGQETEQAEDSTGNSTDRDSATTRQQPTQKPGLDQSIEQPVDDERQFESASQRVKDEDDRLRPDPGNAARPGGFGAGGGDAASGPAEPGETYLPDPSDSGQGVDDNRIYADPGNGSKPGGFGAGGGSSAPGQTTANQPPSSGSSGGQIVEMGETVDTVEISDSDQIIGQIAESDDRIDAEDISVERDGGDPFLKIDTGHGTGSVTTDDLVGSFTEGGEFQEEDIVFSESGDGFSVGVDSQEFFADDVANFASRLGLDEKQVEIVESDDGGVTFQPSPTVQQEYAEEQLEKQRTNVATKLGLDPGKIKITEEGGKVAFQPTRAGQEELLEEGVREEQAEQQAGQQGGSSDDTGVLGGFGGTVGSAIPDVITDPAQGAVDTFQGGADDVVRDLSGGDVGISQDWTSPDDFQEADMISDDFTSMEDSGGLLNTVDFATGGYLSDLYDESRTQVTPHAAASLDDPDALEARQEKDEAAAEGAAGFADALASGDLPSLSESGGALYTGGEMAERAIGDLGEGVADLSPTAGMGPRIGSDETVGDVPGNLVSGLVSGVGMGVGASAQAFPSVGTDVLTMRDGERTPTQIEGAGDLAVNFGEQQVEMAKSRPVSTAALVGLPAVSAVPAGVRGYRSTRGVSETVQFSEITSQRGAQGDLPNFRTSPDAPTRQAVGEVRTRARNQPEAAQRATGTEEVLWHSTEAQLGPEFAATRGGSELPGLFTSPDASPLRLSEGPTSASLSQRLRPGRPDLSTTPDRLAAFEGNRISAMPESATGSGRVRQGGEYAPDPSTSGARFLEGQADTGTAYVRPTGSRTTELEAIYPPGSEFAQTTRLGVEMPSGRTVPADVFQRTGASAEAPSGPTGGGMTAGNIASGYSTSPRSTAGLTSIDYGAALGTTGGVLDSGSGGSSSTETSSVSSSAIETAPVTEPTIEVTETTSSTGDATTEPMSSGPSEPTTAQPTEPTSQTPSEPPTSPPSSTPSEPSSRPPTITPGEPTTPPQIRKPNIDSDTFQETSMVDRSGIEAPVYTDFVDPLSGDVLETERPGGSGVDLPGFGDGAEPTDGDDDEIGDLNLFGSDGPKLPGLGM